MVSISVINRRRDGRVGADGLFDLESVGRSGRNGEVSKQPGKVAGRYK